jgi:hypothetical protein
MYDYATFSGVTFAYGIFLGWTRQNMSVASPKSSLLDGAEILEKVLAPQDFHFQFRGDGKSSGGASAWGEFV